MNNIYDLPDPQQIDGNPDFLDRNIENALLESGYFNDDKFFDENGKTKTQPSDSKLQELCDDVNRNDNWQDIKNKPRVIRRKP